MTTIFLIRHAVNDWVKTGKLAGWTPEVHLNEDGKQQAAALGARLASHPIKAIYSSPLERTMETAEAVAGHHPGLAVQQFSGIGEVGFGDWQGEEISRLSKRKMWHVIQYTPSRAYFPNGETIRAAQARAVDALESLLPVHPREVVAVVSHSDIIKLILAHFLGMHLDLFQRIVVSPASLSVLELGHGRPFVALMNDTSHYAHLKNDHHS